MVRRGKRRALVWGRQLGRQVVVGTGVTLSVPLDPSVLPDEIEEATVVRVIIRLQTTGNVADVVTAGLLLEDEDGFPAAVDIETQTDRDYLWYEHIFPIVVANVDGSSVVSRDIRSSRKLRERDRTVYFAIRNRAGNAAAVTVNFSIMTLWMKA